MSLDAVFTVYYTAFCVARPPPILKTITPATITSTPASCFSVKGTCSRPNQPRESHKSAKTSWEVRTMEIAYVGPSNLIPCTRLITTPTPITPLNQYQGCRAAHQHGAGGENEQHAASGVDFHFMPADEIKSSTESSLTRCEKSCNPNWVKIILACVLLSHASAASIRVCTENIRVCLFSSSGATCRSAKACSYSRSN